MEETIKKIEEVIAYHEDRLEHTSLPRDEKEELRRYASIYRMKRTIEDLRLYSNDSLG